MEEVNPNATDDDLSRRLTNNKQDSEIFGDTPKAFNKVIKAPVIERLLTCSLVDLYKGVTKRMKHTRNITDMSGKAHTVEEILSIYVKPGWKRGTKITFPEKGEQEPGVIPADLVFTLEEKRHHFFTRDGNDLVVNQDISLVEALTGKVTVKLTTLDSRYIVVPVTEIAKPGYELTVPDEGMPISKEPGKKGNLRVKFNFRSSISTHTSTSLNDMLSATGEEKESEPSTSSTVKWLQSRRHFQFSEILLGTQNFDELLVIGHGGFGKVYKGFVSIGSSLVVAAIKRLDSMSNQGSTEFWAEVEMLSKLRHCNLVSLFGYCNHGKEMILVYEYMPNGTLEDHLHKRGTAFSWAQRLEVCIGAARGLQYLHTGTGIEVGVIHRDVKTANILLHETWAAKISDFGLSKIGPTNQPSTGVSTAVKGTFGYLDPDYYATGKLTRKSDVYAFGVVLLEVLCRKRAVFDIDRQAFNLAIWAQESIKERNLKNIIDSDLRGQISSKCLKEFVRITKRCLHINPKQRPTMAEAVVSLESVKILQEKSSNSLQTSGTTIFGKMVDMFPFASNDRRDSKTSSTTNGNGRNTGNMVGDDHINVPDTRELTAHCRALSLKKFKFSDLKKATNNFSEDLLLGRGSFGSRVFLGWVNKNTSTPSRQGVGLAVAVKRLCQDNTDGYREWEAEVNILGGLIHPNIITLLGYSCGKKHECLLVYECMQNRTLWHFLHTEAPEIAEPLSWRTRITILIGVARGLAYLHSLKDQVIHRDVKSSCILLDQEFSAKLGNFGFAKYGSKIGEEYVSTRIMGTLGYQDPEFLQTSHCSVKADVYSFGVVLLETLTGLRPIVNRAGEPVSLATWASQFSRVDLIEMMDPQLKQMYPEEVAFECFDLALRCVAKYSNDRPSSEEVLQSLEKIYAEVKVEHPQL